MIYDVAIVGAGPGGAICAHALADSGLSVVVLDKASFPRDKICGDALSGKVASLLKRVSPELLTALHDEFAEKVGSWGVRFVGPNKEFLDVPFKLEYDAQKQTAPGFIAKRIDFDNFLVEKLKKHTHIEMLSGFDTEDVVFGRETVIITSKAKKSIEARFVVGADGAHSIVAKKVNKFKVEQEHYCAGLRAYYQNVEGLHPHNFIELHFLKEFLPGYFWIFPLPNGAANVGVGMLSSKVSRKKVNLKEEMKRIIREEPTIAHRFKNATVVDDIKGFGLPLGSKKRSISGERYILVGDAASLIDPFTGEGIANAMISGHKAAVQIKECFKKGNFSASFMEAYDKDVYNRLWKELRLSHIMQKLTNYPSLFNLVIKKANNSPTLKSTIVAMFDNIDLRKQLQSPKFYAKLLLGK